MAQHIPAYLEGSFTGLGVDEEVAFDAPEMGVLRKEVTPLVEAETQKWCNIIKHEDSHFLQMTTKITSNTALLNYLI